MLDDERVFIRKAAVNRLLAGYQAPLLDDEAVTKLLETADAYLGDMVLDDNVGWLVPRKWWRKRVRPVSPLRVVG